MKRISSRLLTAFLILSLCSHSVPATPPRVVQGTLIDQSGATIRNAQIRLFTTQGTDLQQTVSDDYGEFQFAGLVGGFYTLQIEAAGFQSKTMRLQLTDAAPAPLRIELSAVALRDSLTVTATRASLETAQDAAHLVSVQSQADFQRRPLPTVGSALENTPGILVQQTTTGQVSPHLRGLTGYQTLLLIDGIRLNTSIFRSGPNQYLGFVDPSQVQSIEAVLGPTGAAYGSDALGGTINLLTPQRAFRTSSEQPLRGEFRLFGASADLSGGGSALLSGSSKRLAWMMGGAWQKHNDLRAGGGFDSRNVYRRYFGLSGEQVRDLLGNRMQDTGYGQRAAHAKLAFHATPAQTLTLWYQHGDVTGVRAYRDLLGGLGRLRSDAEPQTLDFFYARYEKLNLGKLDSLTGTFSLNSQRDDTLRQGQRFTDFITRDQNRVDVFGYTVQATSHLGTRHSQVMGGELYAERIASRRFEDDPRTNLTVERRALYPNGSRYATTAAFAQNSSELIRQKVRVIGGIRFTRTGFQTFAAQNRDASGKDLGVTDSTQHFQDFTWHGSVSWQITSHLGMSVLTGRGFRAPNLNDLGAIGLTGNGFELPLAQAIPAGAILSADAGEAALPVGRSLRSLRAESLQNYEASLRFQTRRCYARAQVFDAEFKAPIVRRTLLFPATQVPTSLAGIPVTLITPTSAQKQQGVVTVATSADPRAVKAFVNDGQSRYYGLESLLQWNLSTRWSLEGNYSILAGRELNPNRPARRLPPQQGYAALRYSPSGRWWAEVSSTITGAQTRLSAADLDDERIGASRRRSDIATFFRSAIVSPYISSGADGLLGNTDDIFLLTRETLLQIQNRVLPLGATLNGILVTNDSTRVPLLTGSQAWTTINLRGGWKLHERLEVTLAMMNLTDRSYRSHGSGIDAPGRSVFVGIKYTF